jgi:plasmid maintenance system antidote protein VapI
MTILSEPQRPGDVIAALLRKHNMKQKDLCDATHWSASTVSQYIHGKRKLGISSAYTLSLVFPEIMVEQWVAMVAKQKQNAE